MNVLKKLTKRNLTLNRKRTIVTIIGIILSTALIVCVSGMVTSFRQTLINEAIRDNGYYHAEIKDMTKEDLLALEDNRNIKNYYISSEIGYAPIKSDNIYKPYVYVTAYNESALNNLGIEILEGRLPRKTNEILISNHLIESGGYEVKIGDTISFNIGKRYIYEDNKKFYLNQNNPLTTEEITNDNEIYDKPNEYFEENKILTYEVVGIIKRPSYEIEDYSAPGYTCITFSDEIHEKGNAFILYKNAKDYDKNTQDIAKGIYDTGFNSQYLRWLGVTDSKTMYSLYLVAGIVITIIIISSVFVIKNSFAISIIEKYKMYGMLRSVGATSKQIKKNVLYEGFFLGLIAIPIGIFCGIFAIVVLVWLINFILGEYLGSIKFVYSIPFLPIIISIILASLTIYFSTIFIARKAGKITAIDAIRSNNDIKIKSKKLKTPILIKKLFKTGGVIAYKNLKRNKKKYRTTVVSIVVSVFVFISLSSFIDFAFKMSNVYYTNVSYNLAISVNGNMKKEDTNTIYKKISSFEEVKKYSLVKTATLNFDIKKYISDFSKSIKKLYGFDELDDNSIMVVSLGDDEYSRYLKKIGLDQNKMQNKAILIDEYQETIDKKKYIGNMLNLKNNDVLELEQEDSNKISFEIIRSNERPMGLELTYYYNGILVVSDEIMEGINYYNSYLYIDASDAKSIENKIEALEKESDIYKNIFINNIEDDIKENNAMILIVSIFLYGFISVISLIGITNIFNTITTNMNLRSKEFAMLKSVGMTKKEFNRMIRLESIFYGFKSLIIGIPLGLAGSYLIYLAFKEGMEFGYRLPIKSLIIVILFVSLIISIIMKYSLSKINKQNIIETIRNDNI